MAGIGHGEGVGKLRPLLLVALFLSQAALAASPAPSAEQSTATPIKHVIFVMMENHSFDNIFGLYPTMNKSESGSVEETLQRPDDVLSAPPGAGLTQVPNGTYWTINPNELNYASDWNGGKMDGFLSGAGSQAMTYFSSSQLAIEWDWAEEYAIADRYFSSCLCMTNPNRLYSLAGYGNGITDDTEPPPYIPVNQSIFGELSKEGVSWGYYVDNPAVNIFPLEYFDGIGGYSSQIQTFASFDSALSNGSLPSVSWVMPVGGGASGISQHPRQNVTVGEEWLLGIVDNVMRSEFWNSSAIFISYDEGGGYYDHVPPPVLDGVQLGFRVPLILISPYAKENYVSQTMMNHASGLAFVDYNWQIPPLNSFVSDSALPLDMFDFSQPYSDGSLVREPVVLDSGSSYPVGLQIPLREIPYQRTGATNVTLASLGGVPYVSVNQSVGGASGTLPEAAAVAVGALVVVYFALRRSRRERRTTVRSSEK